ncbi:putative F-box/LRR-repeat protein At4g13960 [Andrographis paniculata]|uniref:putative F-box/LRR-repeat protein At4g13960 n=1 Tax=Andrographis paniculata TaxID=175694 RepID=UPI0021E82A1D|nr:putative F-box/LRR-repeat protein At4g13960 [Andrographis paniculata]
MISTVLFPPCINVYFAGQQKWRTAKLGSHLGIEMVFILSMEIEKGNEATDNELQLPESLIQRIQSFLTGKKAASTIVLSKSWYNAWLTRPNLDFDDRYFRGRNHEMFLNFLRVSMGRMLTVARNATTPIIRWNPLVEFANERVGSVVDDRINVSQFMKLRCLVLESVRLDQMVFSDFLTKFPYLEDLKVHYCNGCVRFDLSSPSLEYISLANHKKLSIHLVDVPNIRNFKFSGSIIPSLACTTTSKEWESDIRFTVSNTLGSAGFLEMMNFLTELSHSKISLVIELLSSHVEFVPVVHDFPKPVVENLTLRVHCWTSVPDLLDGLIWSFQPKVVNQELIRMFYRCQNMECELLHQTVSRPSAQALQFLYEKLTNFESFESCTPTEKIIGWHELKEVNMEYFEDVLKEWLPLPRKSLLTEMEVHVRFHLRWG